jgi:hypothetical protein
VQAPENLEITFFNRWQLESTASMPGTISALTIASWVTAFSFVLLILYRQGKYAMKVLEARRKQREAEAAYADLQEEKHGGKIDSDKFIYWRDEILAEKKRVRMQELQRFIASRAVATRGQQLRLGKTLNPQSVLDLEVPKPWDLSTGQHINRYKPAAFTLKRSAIIQDGSNKTSVADHPVRSVVVSQSVNTFTKVKDRRSSLASNSDLKKLRIESFGQPRKLDQVPPKFKDRTFTAHAMRREVSSIAAAKQLDKRVQVSSYASKLSSEVFRHPHRSFSFADEELKSQDNDL